MLLETPSQARLTRPAQFLRYLLITKSFVKVSLHSYERVPYVTCRSAEGLSQVCHRSVQSYSRPIWRKTEVCKSAYCLWQTSHENDFFFDCVLPFILFAASLLQTFRDFWWLCNKDLLLCLHLICSRRCADNHLHETCGAVQRHKIASK